MMVELLYGLAGAAVGLHCALALRTIRRLEAQNALLRGTISGLCRELLEHKTGPQPVRPNLHELLTAVVLADEAIEKARAK